MPGDVVSVKSRRSRFHSWFPLYLSAIVKVEVIEIYLNLRDWKFETSTAKI